MSTAERPQRAADVRALNGPSARLVLFDVKARAAAALAAAFVLFCAAAAAQPAPAPVEPQAQQPAPPGPGAPEQPAPAQPPAPIAAPAEPGPVTGEQNARAGAGQHGEEPSAELRYTLENIEIRGNTKTRSRVVLRYVPFRPGDVLDVEDPEVELTRYRLLGTGFFRDVQFSLRKGSRRGYVVLVIEVAERNTVVINDLWLGVAADADTRGQARPLTPYAGLDVAETNLAGTGITLGSAIGLARDQLALRVRFLDPAFLGSSWMTSGTLLFNDAQDYFGNADVFFVDPQLTVRTEFAVVQYKRFGGSVGVGHDLGISTQLWAQYRLEGIDATLPLSASHVRGTRDDLDREPIAFSILPGRSVLSTLSATLSYDTRDKPILPTRGWFGSATGEVSLAPFGSDYPYSRLDLHVARWWELPWRHVLRLSLFGGAISGDAPFFEQYYATDFSDFRATRVLGLNVERRPAPNFFNTVIAEIRRGEYAAKIDGEYRIPLYRGSRSVFGIDFFTSVGLFGIIGAQDISDPPGGYSGAALVPVDFTANLGFRMDTSAGGFTFAFANVLGFIPALSEE